MNLFPYWRVVISLVIVSLCSALMGAAVTLRVQNQRAASQSRLGLIGEAALARLESALQLSPQQSEQIRPLVENCRVEIQEAASEALEKAAQSRLKLYEEIRPLLTPEQRVRFDQISTRHERLRERWQKGEPLLPELRNRLRERWQDRLQERTNRSPLNSPASPL